MKIYYSVQNGGDGSAYPWFFTTQKLADWDQEHMDEGWGEPCTGDLEVLLGDRLRGAPDDRGEIVCPEAMDEVSYWLRRTEDEGYEPWVDRDLLLASFFPDGLPRFEVRVREDVTYYDIYVDGVRKGERFGWNYETEHAEATEAGRAALEERLNAG